METRDPTATATARHGRRRFLAGAGIALAGGLGAKLVRDHDEAGRRADVIIARADSYERDLATILADGLAELGLQPSWARGQTILLKPNLVEPSADAPHVTTHPAVVRAAAEVFRDWGAMEVLVADGPGHCRDTDLVLERSALGPVLDDARLRFIDLNYDDTYPASNPLGLTGLRQLHLPETLRRVDRIVSLPKLKTHHWAGVTLSMKNLFGMMPGRVYGWPKNVFHHRGIARSILDIVAAVAPDLAIVDGIIGMEGDGPIMGTPRAAGVLVLGTNPPAVDATATRLMGFDPRRVEYLAMASGRLGPIAERHITQRGESIAALAQPFALLDHPAFPKIR
ncbi:MAG TPA: DUF362 domain-containing protein [Isosphaeraceae bacterium]|nr:DUF362 domain-containing protein [Isosphaeraceae bacterium]